MVETVTYPNAPTFDPDQWNADRGVGLVDFFAHATGVATESTSLAYNTNCYEFAVNANRNKDFNGDNPGAAEGIDMFDYMEQKQISYEAATIHGATIDGLEPYMEDGLPPHREGYYPVALFIREEGNNPDYHWLRANQDGTWSDSAGHGKIKLSRDENGQVINSPHTVEEYAGSYDFSMYFYVPEDGIATGLSGHIERLYERGDMETLREKLAEGGLATPEEQKAYISSLASNAKAEAYAGYSASTVGMRI